MEQPGRKFAQSTNSYRYSINRQEKDRELNENITTAEFWEYDSRLGRRWNIDPKSTTGISSYNCFAGNPILLTDINGDSIPVRFLNSSNNLYESYSKGIPDKVQSMYNQEYGITVGYNSETGMLYKTGDFETENKNFTNSKKNNGRCIRRYQKR